ncbi:imidazoleglycerol-phosphate dehydratase HisB [uncultured Helicobacter sp.]|uniref:imidazoleglycerol-phosphate dehydratase HisB n=1 Tax=uncultured Helicobacter sp. TaxID=175537 RepID=UPI00374EA410
MKDQILHTRKTKETDISLEAVLYGSGKASISSGVGFFDHMLESFSKHSLIDLTLKCQGDTHIDDHHSVEDCGITLGEALGQMIYPLSGVERFGNAHVVMDEACVACDIDLANRAFLVFEVGESYGGKIGSFDVELVEEFFRAVCFNANISAHIVCLRGKNLHHITEAMFKAFGVSLRRALTPNPRISTPSTKGVL